MYQTLPRLFGNRNLTRKVNGTLAENGCGKLSDFDAPTLRRIHTLGVTHIWYTGVVRHATATDYSRYGIPRQHPAVVKGRAGSPYAITDYYDIDPDLADDVEQRMDEWSELPMPEILVRTMTLASVSIYRTTSIIVRENLLRLSSI